MPVARFKLAISARALRRYYQGHARTVHATTLDGRSLAFPAEHLRRFVSVGGVYGVFELHYDEHGRFVRLLKLSAP